MRKACITTNTHTISRFLRMNLEGLMLELRWETDFDQRAFLAREIAFDLALHLWWTVGAIRGPRSAKSGCIMHHRLETVVRDAQPGDTQYLTAFAPPALIRWAETHCRVLKVETRRGRIRVGICVLLGSRDLEPLLGCMANRSVCNVSLVLPVVTTHRASEELARLAEASRFNGRQHG